MGCSALCCTLVRQAVLVRAAVSLALTSCKTPACRDQALLPVEAAWDPTLLLLQIIRAEMFEHVRRTEDGTPWEVQLTRGVVHPNIVRCLAYGTFQDDVRADACALHHA